MARKTMKTKRRRKARMYKKPQLKIGGFSNREIVKLRYVETQTINPGAGPSMNVVTYKANDAHQPGTSTHQPSNYDRWERIYSRYTVVGAKMRVYPIVTTNTNVIPRTLITCLSHDGGDISSIFAAGGLNNLIEQPNLRTNLKYSISGVNNQQYNGLPIKFSAKKYFGTKNIVGTTPYQAGVGGPPSNLAYFEIGYGSADGANDPGAMTCRVIIDYYVVFSELKPSDNSATTS